MLDVDVLYAVMKFRMNTYERESDEAYGLSEYEVAEYNRGAANALKRFLVEIEQGSYDEV